MSFSSGSYRRRRRSLRIGRFQVPAVTQPSIGRLRLVWVLLLAGSLLLSLNLLRLQVFHADELLARAKQQQTLFLRPFVPRRSIIDHNGNVVAIDQPSLTLYAHPRYFKNVSISEVASKLSDILGQPVAELQRKLESAPSGIRMADNLSEDTANRIKGLFIDGLDFEESRERLYPQQDLLASVLGYVDLQQQSQGGVEYSYQHLLKRDPKAVRMNRTGSGKMLPDGIPNGFVNQDDLRLKLTIDTRLQRAVANILNRRVAEFGAKRGLVMVMDAQDGSMLAMVTNPTFDPNRYWETKDIAAFKNWGLTDLYEPGSTFKPVNMAIALEAGTVHLTDHFNDPGAINVGGWTIKNAGNEAHGLMSLAQIIQYSSNVGMVQIAQTMKPSVYYSWLQRVGLGQPTGIDLPFEAEGYLKDRQLYMTSPIEVATTAFGQGFAMTPIQLIKLHGMLANGGKMVTPHVVDGLYDAEGKPHWQPQRAMPKQVFSPTNTNAILRMMELVVEKGTGQAAQVPGYRIAGKTGTAQKANASGGYSESRYITSFVAIFPVDQPRYVVLSVIDEPKGLAYGGTTAAPIVKEVVEVLVGLEKIPPSQPDAQPLPQ